MPRQRIQKQVSVTTARLTLFSQQQKGRFHDNREINCSTRCPLFGTPGATSRGLLEDYERLLEIPRVEAGSNTSTVTLRVVGEGEKGSLKSETVIYGCESQGTRTQE
jgi:hypothetical protein